MFNQRIEDRHLQPNGAALFIAPPLAVGTQQFTSLSTGIKLTIDYDEYFEEFYECECTWI